MLALNPQEIIISRDNVSPLALDVRDLEHRPGTMRLFQETLPAPKDFGNAIIGAPEGSDMAADLRLESVVDGILVSGTVTARLHGECRRCLDPVEEDMTVEVQELFLFDAPSETPEEDDDADEMYTVQDDHIDLEPMLRDAAITKLPFQPVCREDCPGLCAQCGARLEDDPDHVHEVLDPRWSALAGLLEQGDESPREER